MKKATDRQKNDSVDIKRGIILLEDSIDVMEYLRKSWSSVEKSLLDKNTQTKSLEETQQSLAPKTKRAALSPVGGEALKKKKEENTTESWTLVQRRASKLIKQRGDRNKLQRSDLTLA